MDSRTDRIEPSGSTDPALTRRRFLIRALAVAGGAAAVPLIAQSTDGCHAGATPRDPAAQNPETILTQVSENDLRAVTENILCEGRCGKTVYTGEMADGCSIATEMKLEAARYLASGMTPPQVLDQFAADFGEDVLAAPPKEGLNLVPWLLPAAGVIVGAATVGRAMAHWGPRDAASQPAPPPVDPDLAARVEDEVLRDL